MLISPTSTSTCELFSRLTISALPFLFMFFSLFLTSLLFSSSSLNTYTSSSLLLSSIISISFWLKLSFLPLFSSSFSHNLSISFSDDETDRPSSSLSKSVYVIFTDFTRFEIQRSFLPKFFYI